MSLVLILVLLYGIVSWSITLIKIGYLITCLCNKKFRSKQPLLWKESCLCDIFLYATLIWLPALIIKLFVEIMTS